MYAACLYCSFSFGHNDCFEHLRVGRRLAFDAAQGRLWVVCRACGRWNLTPLDERWEAIEDCERAFRGTRVRASSDQIGLARLPEGTELIRIGHPLRNEFAAWRYGSQFLERHRDWSRRFIGLAAFRLSRRPALIIPFEGGERLAMNLRHVLDSRLVRDDDLPEGWSLEIEHLAEPRSLAGFRLGRRFRERSVTLSGGEARLAAAMILPTVNARGGSSGDVAEAVRWLEISGGPGKAIATFARSGLVRPPLVSALEPMRSMHPEVRLALEMALHEEEERRALAGELSVLTWVWRREERLAAIADRLGLPEAVEARLGDLKRGISRVVPTRTSSAPE